MVRSMNHLPVDLVEAIFLEIETEQDFYQVITACKAWVSWFLGGLFKYKSSYKINISLSMTNLYSSLKNIIHQHQTLTLT